MKLMHIEKRLLMAIDWEETQVLVQGPEQSHCQFVQIDKSQWSLGEKEKGIRNTISREV
jgi:hypothetical protein